MAVQHTMDIYKKTNNTQRAREMRDSKQKNIQTRFDRTDHFLAFDEFIEKNKDTLRSLKCVTCRNHSQSRSKCIEHHRHPIRVHSRSNGKRGYEERERNRADKKERERRFKWFVEHTVPCMNPTTCTIEGHFHVASKQETTRVPKHEKTEEEEYLHLFTRPQQATIHVPEYEDETHVPEYEDDFSEVDEADQLCVTPDSSNLADFDEKKPKSKVPDIDEAKPTTEVPHSKLEKQQAVKYEVNLPCKKETNTKLVAIERINLLNKVSKVIIGFNPDQPIKCRKRGLGFIGYIVKLFGKDKLRVIDAYDKLRLGGTVAHGQKLWGYHNGTFLDAETQIIAQCFTTVRAGDAYVERAAEALNDPSFANYSILDAEGKVRAGIFEMVKNSLITKFPNSHNMENDMTTFTNTVCYICTRLILNAYVALGSTRSSSRKMNFFTGAGSRTPLSVVPRTESVRKPSHSWKSARLTGRSKYSQEKNGLMAC